MAEQIITKRDEVKGLLRKLFRSDQADLDFGIYRIINFKRKEVEKFIDHDLIDYAESEFREFSKTSLGDLQRELEEERRKIEGLLGVGIFNSDGEPSKYLDVKAVQEYEEKRKRLKTAEVTEEQVNDVFSHVYEFFSRYYEEGDFIPKTRYSGRDKYYVPYNGEEVMLHWATKNMYYVKTGEYFKKYSFRAMGFLVTFRLVEAEVETGNIKGEKKYFILSEEEPMHLDSDKSLLEIMFNYRSLSEEEKGRYGTRNIQSALVNQALEKLRPLLESSSILGILRQKAGEEQSLMEKHLNAYVDRNTKDFFIHKDLKGFLSKEIEFYINNEVLNLIELETTNQSSIKLLSAKIKAIRNISQKIIEFLNQIESYQKNLFEKKKFILKTDYCITLDLISPEFYDEISKNEKQISEWEEVYRLGDIIKNLLLDTNNKTSLIVDILNQYKYLMINTKNFSIEFKDKLLNNIDNLDDVVNCTLIKSENYQALNLLRKKYKDVIKCIYIDPPYNTGKDGFLYKDNYQHSSWLSLLYDRLNIATDILCSDGILWISIDDKELSNLKIMIEKEILGMNSYLGEIVWKTTTDNNPSQIAKEHEYILGFAKNVDELKHWSLPSQNAKMIMNKYEELKEKNGNKPDIIQNELRKWLKQKSDDLKGSLHFNSVDEKGVYSPQNPSNPHPNGYFYKVIHPITNKPCNLPTNGFRFPQKTFEKMVEMGDIEFGSDETTIPKPKKRLEIAREFLRSVFYEDNRISVSKLDDMFGKRVYENPKSLNLLSQLIRFSTNKQDIIIDFFAGSGTTAESIIKLNKENNSLNKYILVEMGNHFETIIIPRICKSIYSDNWKNGIPQKMNGNSYFIKYQYVEQYEDTIHNIEFKTSDDNIQKTFDHYSDYFLSYVLENETYDSRTRLIVESFKTPFNYRINTLSSGEERENPVDLVETFNYLIGLNIRKIRTYQNGNCYYRTIFGERDHEQVAVIWRDTSNLNLERDKQFIESTILSRYET